MLIENFLKLGAPDEVVFTDLINSHMCGQMTFQVVGNTIENFGIAFTFCSFGGIYFWKFFLKDVWLGLEVDLLDQVMMQL